MSDLTGQERLTPASHEIRPGHLPVVPIPQDPFVPTRRLERLVNLFPRGQFIRYLCVGGFNTLFGYVTFAAALTLLSPRLPQRWLPLGAVLATLVSTPVNITVAYLGYKFFVFRTKGRFLAEWLKCFAVYGAGTIPGLFMVSLITRLFQWLIHGHAAQLRVLLTAVEAHLGGTTRNWLEHFATGKALAGYLAGAAMIGVATVYSFLAHKNITFRRRNAA